MVLLSRPQWGQPAEGAVASPPASTSTPQPVQRAVSAPLPTTPSHASGTAKSLLSQQQQQQQQQSAASDRASAAIEYLVDHRDDFIKRLCSLVRIQSVSSAPSSQSELIRAAEAVAMEMRCVGLENIQTLNIPNAPPYVYGEWMKGGPGALTLLLYAHYDVLPPGDVSRWESPPFEPTVREGKGGKRLYGRGACDDKAGVVVHLAAVESCIKELGYLPVNVKVLIEGEEELGSPHLSQCLDTHEELLSSDVALLLSTGNYDTGVPTLTYSLRGIVGCTLEMNMLHDPIHSGNGGAVIDPIIAMSHLIASFHTKEGTVAIKGFYDDCRKIPKPERDRIHKLQYNEQRMREDYSLLEGVSVVGEKEFMPLERVWFRPSLNVIGFDACPIAMSSNRILPGARARIQCRVAPHQTPAKILRAIEDHCKRVTPFGCEAKVVANETVPPWLCEPSGPMFRACEAGMSAGYHAPVALLGCGGSIPFVVQIARFLPESGVALGVGLGDPESRAHSENESLCLDDLHKAMAAMVHIFFQLSALRQVQL